LLQLNQYWINTIPYKKLNKILNNHQGQKSNTSFFTSFFTCFFTSFYLKGENAK